MTKDSELSPPAVVEKREARAALATRFAVILAAAFALVVVGALGAVLVEIREQALVNGRLAEHAAAQAETAKDLAARNAETGRTVERIARQIAGCTQPGGRCYERGRAGQAAVIGEINAITLLAAACADQPRVQTHSQLRACVERRVPPLD